MSRRATAVRHDRACRQGSPAATAADSDGLVQQRVHAGDAGEAPERLNAAQSVFCAAQASMFMRPSSHVFRGPSLRLTRGGATNPLLGSFSGS